MIRRLKDQYKKTIVEKTKQFHQMMEEKKKNTEHKIAMMKENALNDIKNISIKISIEAVKNLITNSIDKKKLEKFYSKSIEQTKSALKQSKV